jgi:hypothetical protein
MEKSKASETEMNAAEMDTSLSRREFLAGTVSTVTAFMVGTLVASAPSSANTQSNHFMRVFDRPGSLNNSSELVHGQVTVRPAPSLSSSSASANDKLLVGITLKDNDGKPISGMRVTGHFGDVVTDKYGHANLTGRMKDLILATDQHGRRMKYLPEDRNWDIFFNTRNRSNSIRIDSGLAAKSSHNGDPTTICTSGRLRLGKSFTPIVACLIIS